MTARTDTQMQQRALVSGLRSLLGIYPLIAVLATGAGGVWYLSAQWGGVKADVDYQGKALAIHSDRLNSLAAMQASDKAEIQTLEIQFAAIKQMLIDLQNGRKTDLGALPKPDDFLSGSSGG